MNYAASPTLEGLLGVWDDTFSSDLELEVLRALPYLHAAAFCRLGEALVTLPNPGSKTLGPTGAAVATALMAPVRSILRRFPGASERWETYETLVALKAFGEFAYRYDPAAEEVLVWQPESPSATSTRARAPR